MTTQIPVSIDDILQATPIGSLDKAVGNNLYGFNHDQTRSAVPSNREQQGFLFFTRPQLNMQEDNIANIRKLYPLLSDSNTSIHRFIRTTLDPRLMVGYKLGNTRQAPLKSTLTNNEMAFIPVLTNNAVSSSGWPDMVVPVWTSDVGRLQEQTMFVDGLVDNYGMFDIDVTFRNTMSDPILYLMYVWGLYSSYVFSGKLIPYPDMIAYRRLDYNTRLFRVRLDRNRKTVTKIMSTGPALIVGNSVGQFGDLNMDETISSANKDISIRFQCQGFEIFDEILVKEFNDIVEMFKVSMRSAHRDRDMVRVPRSISYMFQHRAYPRIDPSTHYMEWWVDRTLFDERTQAYIAGMNSIQDDEDVISSQQIADINNA